MLNDTHGLGVESWDDLCRQQVKEENAMTRLWLDELIIPGGNLGPENPLPNFHVLETGAENLTIDDSVPECDREYVFYGCDTPSLPYRLQDNYDRERTPQALKVAILENEILRATFLLQYGGRLWSLFDKRKNRDLLFTNPVFQLGNLGYRDAWFTGGVEWNVSVVGHTPLTCSPLFAARLEDSEGSPVLRLYEFERIRQVAYQIDFYLPPDSAFLFARPKIINSHDHTVPMYWWSNIAVPETKDVRVLTPANHAYVFGMEAHMHKVSMPCHNGLDLSYPHHSPEASDYFYRLDDTGRPWITALDHDGKGLVQVSTSRLRGRKLWVWGQGSGSRHWQEFLSEPDNRIIEIQAGLARTQRECLPMEPGVSWSWLEAYGLMEADAARVHGQDWQQACQAVQNRLEELLPEERLESELQRTEALANRPPLELLHRGSGWGALERRRRAQCNQKPFCSDALVFPDDSLTQDQAYWLELLEKGNLPAADPNQPPGCFVIQNEWQSLLEKSLNGKQDNHWLTWYYLGIIYYNNNAMDKAQEAWEQSVVCQPSAWSYRNLGFMAWYDDRQDEGLQYFRKAWQLPPKPTELAIELVGCLVKSKRFERLSCFLDEMPSETKAHPRIQLGQVIDHLEKGEYRQARHILEDLEIANIREGERTISKIWYDLHERELAEKLSVPIDSKLRQKVRREYPLPWRLDFEMTDEK